MSRIYMMADIHGRKNPIRDFYNRRLAEGVRPNSNDVMILLGDSGLNYFFNHRDEGLKRDLMAYSMTYFIIRGNHEERPEVVAAKNPDKWHQEIFWGNWVWVENEFPRIKYALDQAAIYHIPYIVAYCEGTPENDWCDEGEPIWSTWKTLVLPGAFSVDKHYRLSQGWSWFEGEQMTAEERHAAEALVAENIKVDIVLSHTCPAIFEPTDLFLSIVDQTMVDKTTEQFLGHIEYLLKYDTWFWGHFHQLREYPRNQEDGKRQLMLYNDAAIDLREYMIYEMPVNMLKL